MRGFGSALGRGAQDVARYGIFAPDPVSKPGALGDIPSMTEIMSRPGMAADFAKMPAAARMPKAEPNWLDYIGLAGATLQEMGGVGGAVGQFMGARKARDQEEQFNSLFEGLDLTDEERALYQAGQGASVLAQRISDSRDDSRYARGRADTLADRAAEQAAADRRQFQDRWFANTQNVAEQRRQDQLLADERAYEERIRQEEARYRSGRDKIEDDQFNRELEAKSRSDGGLGATQLSQIYKNSMDFVNDAAAQQSNFDTIANNAASFIDLAYPQGGTPYTSDMGPLGASSRLFDPRSKNLEAYTNAIAPLMRQAGSGSSSDTDVAMFQSSVVNINRNEDGNRKFAQGARLMADRHQDYVQFLRSSVDPRDPQSLQFAQQIWSEYAEQNPLFDKNGTPRAPARTASGEEVPMVRSFDDWMMEQMNGGQQQTGSAPDALAPPTPGGPLLPDIRSDRQGPFIEYDFDGSNLIRRK